MIALLGMALILAVLWLLGLAVGNGRCADCGRACAPWSAYCARHDPYGGAR